MYRKDLLDKYQREVPKTWDELEETALYILEKEHENGNKNLEGYAGQFAGELYQNYSNYFNNNYCNNKNIYFILIIKLIYSFILTKHIIM